MRWQFDYWLLLSFNIYWLCIIDQYQRTSIGIDSNWHFRAIDKSGVSWLVIIDWSLIAKNELISIDWLTLIDIDWSQWSWTCALHTISHDKEPSTKVASSWADDGIPMQVFDDHRQDLYIFTFQAECILLPTPLHISPWSIWPLNLYCINATWKKIFLHVRILHHSNNANMQSPKRKGELRNRLGLFEAK